jgi:putative ABC transport system permease protein
VINVAIKDLLGRKLRLVLTSLAIVMGVAMVSGTYVLTDTINAAFSSIFTTAYSGSDAVVTGKVAFGRAVAAPPFAAATLARVRALPGVAAAAGGVADLAQYVGRDGKVLARGGAPGLAFSVQAHGDQRFNPLTLLRGAWPVGAHEVALDTTTASDLHVGVGGAVGILPRGGRELRFRVAGIAEFGHSTTLGGATLAIFDLPTAQSLFHKRGELDQVDVAARPGVSDAALLGQIRAVLPPQTQVRTGRQQAQQSSSDTSSQLSFLRYFLLAFGGIALFVGAFVIANTMTITIAQQTREFATLRSMGALRRQIVAVVVVEAAVTGLCASAIGLFVGLGLAKGLDQLFRAFGADLPQAGLVFAPRTIVVSLLVGVLVTLLASLRPALRATRVPPIAAVREGSILPASRFARFGPAAAVGVCAVAGALAGYGAFGQGLASGTRLPMLAAGVVGLFVGVAMVAPRVTRPIAAVLAWPGARVGGIAGSLARANAMRNPARTASTAAALMIGLALVTTVAVLAQGLRNSFEGAVTDAFHADYALTAQDSVTPLSVDAATALRRTGIATVVAGVRDGQGRAFGKTIEVTAVDPGMSKMLRLKWKTGTDASLEGLGGHGAIVDKDFASSHRLAIGSPLRLEAPNGKTLALSVTAILAPPRGGSPFGPVTTSSAAFDSVYVSPQNRFAFALVPGGVSAANTRRLSTALSAFPNAKIQTERQFIASQEKGLDIFLNLLYILLGLSILVSLFGIVNTLVLTVFERTREIGLLRAVGMTRRQSRRMIRYEAVVTALIGAALGIPIGMGLAELFGRAIGGVPFAVPWGTVLVFVVAAVVVGLVAAIFPARRASRLNVLAALQYE